MATSREAYADSLGRMIEDRTGIIGQMLRYNREQKEYEKAITNQVNEIKQVTTRVRNTSSTLLSMERSFIQISKNVQYLAEAMGAYVTLQEDTDKSVKQQQTKKVQQTKKLQRQIQQSQKEEDEGFNLFDQLFRRWSRLPQSQKRRGPKRGGRRPPRRVPRGAGRISLGKYDTFIKALSKVGRGAGRFIPGVGQVLLVGELAYLIYDDIAAKRDADKASEAAKKYRDKKLEEAKQTAIQRREDQKLTEQEARDLLAVPGITDAELNMFGGREAVQRRAGVAVPTPASTPAREESSAERLARLGVAGTTVGGGRGAAVPPIPYTATPTAAGGGGRGTVVPPLAVLPTIEEKKQPQQEMQRGEIYQPVAAPIAKPPVTVTGIVLPDQTVADAIKLASKQVGVDESIMLAMAKQESGFDPNAKAKTSSAKGLYQFIDSTWKGMVAKYGKTFPELLRGPYDMLASAIAGALYIKENAGFLQRNQIPVTGTTIYASHFLGPGGARTLLSAPPDQIAAEVPGLQKPAAANQFIFYKMANRQVMGPRTVAEVIQVLYNKVGQAAEKYQMALNNPAVGSQLASASANINYDKKTKTALSNNTVINNNTITQKTASAGNMGRRHAAYEYTNVAGA